MSKIEHIAEGITLILGDCRDVLGDLDPGGAVVSDPPYGIKAVLGMGGEDKGDGGMWADVAIEGDESVAVRDEALRLANRPFAVSAKVRTPAPPGTVASVVWDKGSHTGAGDLRLPWKPDFELFHIGGEGWSASKRGSGVLKFNAIAGCVGNRNNGHRFHPFEKPVDLMAHFVERAPAGVIVDPFMGSASTGVAAIRLGRPFIGIEINTDFYNIARRRLIEELRKPDMFLEKPTLIEAKQLSLVSQEP